MSDEPIELEDELTPEEKKAKKRSIIGWSIFFGVVALLMITCIVVIKVLD